MWGHTDTRVRADRGQAHASRSPRRTRTSASRKGDAIIDKIDLTLRDDDGTAPVVTRPSTPSLGGGAVVSHAHRGASGPGAVPYSHAGASVTFWVHAADDGEASVTVDVLGPGEGLLTVNGEKLDVPKAGASSGRDPYRLFLAGGVNKLTVTGASELLVVDRLRVGPSA